MPTKTHFPATPGSGYEWAASLSMYDRHFAGNTFFVCSANGTNSAGRGYSPEAPLASIDYAIGLCTANNDDVILVLPGHTETITAAAGVAADVAGVTIRGLGRGRQRPTVNYTTSANASFDISAAKVTIENITFTPVGVDAVVAAVNVTGADCVIRDCEFELANSTNQAVLGILTAATATRMLVEQCYFHGTTDAGTATAIRHVSGNDVVIRNNVFWGAYTTSLGAIDNTAAVTGLVVIGNVIANNTASSTKGFVWHSSTTGVFANNRIGILSGTAPITAAAGTNGGGGYYSAAAGVTAATLI